MESDRKAEKKPFWTDFLLFFVRLSVKLNAQAVVDVEIAAKNLKKLENTRNFLLLPSIPLVLRNNPLKLIDYPNFAIFGLK